MSNVNFRPWIGKNYLSSGLDGKRILVLGESHYCTDSEKCEKCERKEIADECHAFTEDVLNAYVYNYSGEKYEQTFLCFERAMAGKVLTQEEREDLWNGMAFYNYIQVAQTGPRQELVNTPESEPAFLEVLKELTPDAIIVWGKRLYNTLPDWNGQHSTLNEIDGHQADVWTYNIDGKNIPALAIDHPSCPRGKNWEFWHKVIKTFLGKI